MIYLIPLVILVICFFSGVSWVSVKENILSYFEVELQKSGQTGAPGKPFGLFDFIRP